MRKRILIAGMMLLWSGLAIRTTQADTFLVTVNTVPIQGSAGFAVFDFIGGSPVQNNSASVLGFATDGTLGSATNSGAVSGTLVPGPLTFSDTGFLNEWNQGLTFGSMLSFKLNLTTNFPPGAIPDTFSFFLLDSNQNPFATSDPTGADALFTIDITGPSLVPAVYSSNFASVSVRAQSAVPEPSTVSLMLLGVLALRKRPTRWHPLL